MARDSFIFYRSFFEALKELPENNQLEVYQAIAVYALNQEEPKLEGVSKAIFNLIKPQLDANYRKYENGKQNKSKVKAKDKQKESKDETNVNDNVNVNVNDNVVVVESDSCVDGFQSAIDFYENNIGMLTPYGLQQLQSYYDDGVEVDVIILAMQKAVDNNSRNMNYIKAILNSWYKKGIKTLIEAKNEEQSYKKTKENKKSNFQQREYTDLNKLYVNGG